MFSKLFPFLKWFKSYNKNNLKNDIISGLTVSLILIPQSMAYAQLAGLPAYYGLYASFLPPLIAALFGSSFQLSTGPVAVVSLMTAATLEPIATAGTQGFIEYAIVLALVVGIFQLGLGILRLGLIVNFMSHPVVIGFTNAAAIIIATTQLTKLFGIYVDDAEHYYETIYLIIKSIFEYIQPETFYMGIGSILIMILLKKYSPKLPNVLIAVVITSIISRFIGFEHNYNATIEQIKSEDYQRTIKEYNREVKLISQNIEERATIGDKLDAMRDATTNFQKLLDMEYYDELLGYRIGSERKETRTIREKLRKYKFSSVVQSDGKLVFYEKGKVPDSLNSENRTWTMRVTNLPLNENKLSMKGGGGVVGDIPRGLPEFTIPHFHLKTFFKLFPYAIIISLLGFMEAISIAKAIAAKTGQKIDPNQELIGQGLANIAGAFGKSFPVSGSFSRSAVNYQAGATTGISMVISSLFVVMTLYFLTPLLYHLPKSVLSAIIIVAVIGLINLSSFKNIMTAKWYDGLTAWITFFGTLYFAPHLDKGIVLGVVISVLIFLYKSMRPKVACLSMSQDFSLKPAKDFRLKECSHIAAIRFDGTLFFANASYLEDKVLEIISKKPKLKHIIIMSSGINDIDASGAESLELLIKRMHSAGYGMSFCGLNEKVTRVLIKTKIIDLIGSENIYPIEEEALETIFFKTHTAGSTEAYACPLMNYIPNENSKKEDIKKSKLEKHFDKIEPHLLILTPTIGTEDIRKEFEDKKKKKK
ncbi:MAG: SulP family inorganic anion transporter [Bacteroidetes bacterium]|nr:MAG: SulP family inorganic anion transporter [Bacteroidota bacterium]